jgi:TldD protein
MRRTSWLSRVFPAFICCLVLLPLMVSSSRGAPQKVDLLTVMQEELNRSMDELSKTGEIAPYFISYRIVENRSINIQASYGALLSTASDSIRLLNVDVHVGSYQLDNYHPLRDDYSRLFTMPTYVSWDDADAIKSVLWQETDKKYKEAVERLIKVQSDKAVKTAEENPSDDLSQEKPLVFKSGLSPLVVNATEWEKRLKKYSSILKDYPFVLDSDVSLSVRALTKYLVNSEGSRIQDSQDYIRLSINMETRADDGMNLRQFERYDSRQFSGLPADGVVEAKIREMAEILGKMRTAPVVEPYAGPAILSGRASGVFFHEIFGHRIEGFRQKDETQGQTFARKVGQQILPDFLSVVDDPTTPKMGNTDLNGYYKVDDEGVAAQKVTVVENGVLENFLMSRSPFQSFNKSNGHGRAQEGRNPVSRQGNLIVKSTKVVPYDKLREMLIEECKKQNKPFGFVFQEVEGGFTMTGRFMPNAFNVSPVLVYRVYVDGRPDEIVRGVDLIGTPLTPFGKITAAGDDDAVFNGYCGAESGMVPVSAVSPSLLVTEIEVQKKEKSTTKPPILPPPDRDNK